MQKPANAITPPARPSAVTQACGSLAAWRAPIRLPTRVAAPMEMSARVDNLGNGLIRLGFEDCGAGPEAHIMLSTWGIDSDRVKQLEERWGSALRETFG